MKQILHLSSPFYVHINAEGLILSAGPLITKAAQRNLEGLVFTEVYEPLDNFPSLLQKADEELQTPLWFFVARDGKQRFKSTLIRRENGDYILLNNPVINAIYRLQNYHVNLTDFAPHDSICELIFLQESSHNALSEAVELNETLEKKNAALKSSAANLRELNEELKALLGEIHHRVKNNLALILGLLEMKRMHLPQGELRSQIDEIQNRIRSIALIHESMYRNQSFAHIHLEEYISDLARQISRFFDEQKKIALILDLDTIEIDNTRALPVALIINEVMTNSYKHAFTSNEGGKIEIQLKEGQGQIHLHISDNGIGMANAAPKPSSLGMKLLGMLAKQLKASYTVETNSGVVIHLSIPHVKKESSHS
jgi:two-component sensor histidine kinase